MEKISLFVDGSNMFYSQRELGWHFEYNKILQFFVKGRELVNAFYYTGYDGDFGSEREDFFKALMRMGFTVRVKRIKSMWDKKTGREVVKSNLDIEIVIDMFNTINLYDTAILFSGDGDFERAVELLRSRGKKVVVVAVDTMTALELRNAVGHNFINLRDMKTDFEKVRSQYPSSHYEYDMGEGMERKFRNNFDAEDRYSVTDDLSLDPPSRTDLRPDDRTDEAEGEAMNWDDPSRPDA
ncbi:MAG: NYN domain-containing protein [candidate division Zixibacteria bacterium CG_4_9_14_3_um_filter_46_8]|nr:MAG: NYN domain-containing protein [candidate division Zixibacteria bacterium CG_4_9_14_3_um_filter_46_8]